MYRDATSLSVMPTQTIFRKLRRCSLNNVGAANANSRMICPTQKQNKTTIASGPKSV